MTGTGYVDDTTGEANMFGPTMRLRRGNVYMCGRGAIVAELLPNPLLRTPPAADTLAVCSPLKTLASISPLLSSASSLSSNLINNPTYSIKVTNALVQKKERNL